jgi:predicted ArsR family transcriptional regulator
VASEASLQEQAKALGDPTRHRIFRYLADTDRPVDVAELTSHFELNHNAIRQHLAKLVEAALVIENTSPPEGPGRPRLIYRVDPAADGRWGNEGPYQRLSLLLIDMIASGSTPEVAGRRAGRETRIATPGPGHDPISALQDAIARGGFDPKVRHQGDTIEYILANCPFAEAAAADADTICGLHLGLALGLADQLEGVTVDDLIRRNPHRAGCRLRFHLDVTDVEGGPA